MSEERRFSICMACAKHKDLQNFISANAEANQQCSVCLESTYLSCSSEHTPDLENIMKALIRVYYNEEEYNRHWGGHDNPAALFAEPNEIIEYARLKENEQDTESALDLLEIELSGDPYPEMSKGIGIYAGYDDNGQQNRLLSAFENSEAYSLTKLKRCLRTQNAAELEQIFDAELEPLIEACTAVINANSSFFRARIGYDEIVHDDNLSLNPKARYLAYSSEKLGAPPPPIASAGRLNRQGVSYLYVGSCIDTAISEIRPHPGHYISVGKFSTINSLKVLDFSQPTLLDYPLTDVGLDLFELTQSINRDLSRPITPEQRGSYVSAQFIAELIRRRGFDGVQYQSSVSSGTNLCIFDPKTLRFVPGSAFVFRTKSVTYKHEKLNEPV